MDTFREFATQGTDDQLEPGLFDKIYTEVSVTISSDIWPRYKDAVLKGENIGNSAVVGSQGTDGSGLVDFGKASKQAVAALLRIPYKLEILRHVAQAQGVRENVEFCVQCQSYKMLFSEDDRKPRAKVSCTNPAPPLTLHNSLRSRMLVWHPTHLCIVRPLHSTPVRR